MTLIEVASVTSSVLWQDADSQDTEEQSDPFHMLCTDFFTVMGCKESADFHLHHSQ